MCGSINLLPRLPTPATSHPSFFTILHQKLTESDLRITMNDIEKSSKGDTSTSYVHTPAASLPEEDIYDDPNYDAVFGMRKEGQVDYKSVGW